MSFIRHLLRVALLVQWSTQPTQAQDLNPVNDMCMRWDHQSVVKNNILYIYGGLMYYGNNPAGSLENATKPISGYNVDLIKVDMSASWDWKLNISETIVDIEPNQQTGTPPPQVENGWLYQGPSDSSNIFLYGGVTDDFNTSFPGYMPPYTAQYSLWSYDTSLNTWNQYDLTNTAPLRPSNGFAAEAPDQGLAFYLNGEVSANSSPGIPSLYDGKNHTIGGMVVINTNDNTAQNVSSTGFSGSSPRTNGGMAYGTNIGKNGILVAFGGTSAATWNPTSAQNPTFNSLSEISIYDISSLYNSNITNDGWYTQNATGSIPGPRINFCTVAVSPPDNSTTNIYIYGGQGPNDVPYDDVYVLSLPSFTWTVVYNSTNSPRWSHTCHVVGRSQMLTVGGRLNESCDWEVKGVAILDMSKLLWGSVYDADDDAYSPPDVVSQAVAGRTAPADGWADPGLETLFATNRSAVEDHSASGHHSDTPAIVGGVVGGVGGAAVIAALLGWFFWRKRRGSGANGKGAKPSELDAENGRQELQASGHGERAELQGMQGGELDSSSVAELPGVSSGGSEGEKNGLEKDGDGDTERRLVELPA